MIITGIGSRKTSDRVLDEMTKIGEWVRQNNHWLRSGHADGADWAFETGAQQRCIAYLPWAGFNDHLKSNAKFRFPDLMGKVSNFSAKYHPKWDHLTQGVQRLMARNACQVLGEHLDMPSDYVIAWTPDGLFSGGTGQALRIAADFNISIINMYQYKTAQQVIDIIKEGGRPNE